MHCTTTVDVYIDNVHLNPDVVITPMASGHHLLKLIHTDGKGNHCLLSKGMDTPTLVKTLHSIADVRMIVGMKPKV